MSVQTKNNFYILIIIALIAVFFLVSLKRDLLYIYFIKASHKTTIVANYNTKGKLDGAYYGFINGKIYGKSYFRNGLRDGWTIWYDEETGKKKREAFYRLGKLDSIENVYYKSGNLNYRSGWKNNKRLNSEYHYLDNGILNTYNAFDNNINSNDSYCYVAYDEKGNYHQILGDVFSSFIYSKCKDSTVALINNNIYTCIKDLFINVATPPQLTPEITVFINKVRNNKIMIKENNIVISGIFNKTGAYQIQIFGRLRTKIGAIIKADTLNVLVYKE